MHKTGFLCFKKRENKERDKTMEQQIGEKLVTKFLSEFSV
jgi:hypothetical protein